MARKTAKKVTRRATPSEVDDAINEAILSVRAYGRACLDGEADAATSTGIAAATAARAGLPCADDLAEAAEAFDDTVSRITGLARAAVRECLEALRRAGFAVK